MSPACIVRGDGWIRLCCRVIPRSRQSRFAEIRGEALLIRLAAPPVEGKANLALKRFLADAFGVALGRVHIEQGERNRSKIIRIDAAGPLPTCLQEMLSG